LARPHITGADGQITSPDVIVDAMMLNGVRHPIGQITHAAWQQAAPQEAPHAGFGFLAIGGGPIVLPLLSLSSGTVVLSRQAWRVQALADHVAQIKLNGMAFSEIGSPDATLAAVLGPDQPMPRGLLVAITPPEVAEQAELYDPVLDRRIAHRVHFEPIAEDRWGTERPAPRYSVGPTQKDVTHYI